MNAHPRPDRIPFGRADAGASLATRSLFRSIAALAIAKASTSSGPPLTVCERMFEGDALASMLVRAAVTPTTSTSAAALSGSSVATDLIGALAPKSAASVLFSRVLGVDLIGRNTVTVPDTTTLPTPTFVAEGGPIPTVQVSFDGVSIGPAGKLCFIAGLTGEIDTYTPGTATAIVRRVLVAAMARGLDSVVFDDQDASEVRPAGLLHGVADLGATEGGGLAALSTDLGNIVGAMADAGLATDDVMYIAHPADAIRLRTMTQGAVDVMGSAAISKGTLIGIAPQGVASGFPGVPETEISNQTSLHFDDEPAAISTVGTPAEIAAPVRQLWQQNLMALKVRQKCAWAVVTPGAVQMVASATW
jgi:hypothetical protein